MRATVMASTSMYSDKKVAGALALAMHAVFLVLLVFGVSWQKKPVAPVVADLWASLPPLPRPNKVVSPPEPVRKPPPKPVPKVVALPPRVEPKPVVNPDIALKKKADEKKRKEERLKAENRERELNKAAAEKAAVDKQRKAKAAAEKKKLDAAREVEAKKFRQEKEEMARASAQSSAQDKLVSEYTERIKNKIRGLIVEPASLQGNPQAEFDVVLIPGGEVLSMRLRRSSGVSVYDAAVERAIMKAQPLPLPPDAQLFRLFRELHLSFRPKE